MLPHHPSHLLGSVPGTRVLLGAFLEVICVLAIVGTVVALFPVVKRQNEGVALGYVGLRTLEAGIIAVGVVPLLAVVTLRPDMTGGLLIPTQQPYSPSSTPWWSFTAERACSDRASSAE